jgi:hypothetical protein
MDRRRLLRLRVDRCRALGLRSGRQSHGSERERCCGQSCGELSHRILLSFGVGKGMGKLSEKRYGNATTRLTMPRSAALSDGFRHYGGGIQGDAPR